MSKKWQSVLWEILLSVLTLGISHIQKRKKRLKETGENEEKEEEREEENEKEESSGS